MAINPVTGREEDDGAGGAGGGVGIAGFGAAEAGTGYAPSAGIPDENAIDKIGDYLAPIGDKVAPFAVAANRLQYAWNPAVAKMVEDGTGLTAAVARGKAADAQAAAAAAAGPSAGSPPGAPASSTSDASQQPTPPLVRPGLVKTGSQTTTAREVETKEEKRLQGELVNARSKVEAVSDKLANVDAEKELAARTGAEKVNEASIANELAQRQAQIDDIHRREREARAALEQQKVVEAQKLSDAEKKKYESGEITSLWQSRTSGQRASILLGIALGGIGAAISGDRRNQALDQYNLMVQQDFALQKSKIEQMRQKWIDSRVSVDDANKARDAALVDLDHKYAGLTSQALANAKAKLASRGMTEAQIEADATIQKLTRSALEADAARKERTMNYVREDLKRQEGLRSKVQTTTTHQMQEGGPGAVGAGWISEPTGKPATEQERQADGFAERMVKQLPTLQANPLSDRARTIIRTQLAKQAALEQNPGVNLVALWTGSNKTIESQLKDKDRAAWEAMREFGAAHLRKESGAAINAHEMLDEVNRYAPSVGDKGADASRKIANAQTAASQVARSSFRPTFWDQHIRAGTAPEGIAAPGAPSAAPARQAQPAGTPVQVRNKRTGAIETAYQMSDGRLVRAGEAVAAR